MRNRVRVFSVLLLLLAVLGIPSLAQDETSSAVVSGRITHNGDAVAGVEVRVIYEGESKTAITDDIGIYRVDDVPTGGWVQVFVRPEPEFELAYRNWGAERLTDDLVKDFDLPDGQQLQGQFNEPDGSILRETFWLQVEPIEMNFDLPDDEWLGVTVQKGRFELVLPQGTYELSTETPLETFFLPAIIVDLQNDSVSGLVVTLLDSPPANTPTDAQTVSEQSPIFPVGFVGTFLREAPDDNAEVIASVSSARLPIIGISPDENYYLVDYEGQQGWIKAVGRVEGDLSSVPVVEPEEQPPMLTLGSFGGPVRLAPSSDAEIVARATNVSLAIIGMSVDEDYYLVDFDGQEGWISIVFGHIEGDLSVIPVVGVINGPTDTPTMSEDIPIMTANVTSATIRSAPDVNQGEVIMEEVTGELRIIGRTEDRRYYQVIFEGTVGWLSYIHAGQIDGDISLVPIIDITDAEATMAEANVEPCMVSTDQAQPVELRVGFGMHRGVIASLAADTGFEVKGQNTDDDGGIWYALDKQEATPRQAIDIRGDVVWVAAEDVDVVGDCGVVVIIDATGIIPLQSQMSDESTSDADTPGIVSRTTVYVPGDAEWFDTRITVSAGQTFRLLVSGQVNPCPFDGCAYMGPEGVADRFTPSERQLMEWTSYPMPYAVTLVFIGRVGTGAPFVIGTGGTFTASNNGSLQFRNNDWFPENNLGGYTVVIEVQQ